MTPISTKTDLLRRWLRLMLLPAFALATLPSVTLGCADREKTRVATARPKVGHASIVRMDASSGHVKAVIPVGSDPLLLVPAGGQIWTLQFGDGKLARIDPKTLRDAGFLIVDSGVVWVTIPVLGNNSANQSLWRVDPRTGAVTARAPLLANPVSLAGDGRRYLWVANIDGGKITRVDVTTNKTKNFEADTGPAGVAFGAGSVWVSHYVPEVWRINPETAQVEAKIHIDDVTTRGIAFADGTAWVTTESGVIAIDPATNKVIRTMRLLAGRRERAQRQSPFSMGISGYPSSSTPAGKGSYR